MTQIKPLKMITSSRGAQWSLEHEQDGRSRAAARRLARLAVDLIVEVDADDARVLANDEPSPADEVQVPA